MIRNLLCYLAKKNKFFLFLYVRICKPDGIEYAKFLKKKDVFYHIGENCSIPVYCNITNPEFVSLGNNVRLAGECTIHGHDGVVNMLKKAYPDLVLDRVDKVEISDNVFVGQRSIILPGVKIESNCVIAAGAVVTKDVPSGSIVGGVPAKKIGCTEDLAKKIAQKTKDYPWYNFATKGRLSTKEKKQLLQMRIDYFYPNCDR